MGSVLWAVESTAAYHTTQMYTSLAAVIIASTMVLAAPAPEPGSFLDTIFKKDPGLLGLGGFGAGGLLAAALGYKTKDSILNTINTIANVADAKIGLLNLGANLVGTGIDAVKEIRGEPSYPSHNSYNYAPRYQGRYPPRYNAYG